MDKTVDCSIPNLSFVRFWSAFHLVILLGVLFFAVPKFSFAAGVNPHIKIINLLKQNQATEAFNLANQSAAEWEGEPNFDYAYALSARAVGKFQLAVFAFERVLNNKPDSYLGRYHLAVTYFDMQHWQAALHQFQILGQQKEKHRLSEDVDRYERILKRRLGQQEDHWNNWLQLTVGTDSNANNGIKDEFINIPLFGDVRLFEQSREIQSNFAELQGQLLFIRPIDQKRAWYGGMSGQLVQYEKALAWDRLYLNTSVGYRFKWQQFDFDVGVFYRPLRLDGDNYLAYSGGVFEASYDLTATSKLGTSLSYAMEDYDQGKSRDKKQLVVAFWLNQHINNFNHKLVLRYGDESAQEKSSKHIERALWGASYHIYWQIDNQFAWLANVDFLNGDHSAVEPLFQQKRDTKLTRIETRLNYQFLPQWLASFGLSYMTHDANIALYDYKRSRAFISVRFGF